MIALFTQRHAKVSPHTQFSCENESMFQRHFSLPFSYGDCIESECIR
jgi:hypothetical protein